MNTKLGSAISNTYIEFCMTTEKSSSNKSIDTLQRNKYSSDAARDEILKKQCLEHISIDRVLDYDFSSRFKPMTSIIQLFRGLNINQNKVKKEHELSPNRNKEPTSRWKLKNKNFLPFLIE
jgi:hypothetical protein